MKNPSLSILAASTLAFAAQSSPLCAQQTVTDTQTTTMNGSVQQFAPDALTVTTTTDAPARYQISKTTSYVDDSGNPVSVEVVRSGAPVTVYYATTGDQMVASRVVVHHSSSAATTTTAPVADDSAPISAVGTVTVLGDGIFSVRASTDAPATQYYYSKTTKYVDADGNPVAMSYVKSGVPVTVQYAKIGDRMVASKVIVKRTRHTTTTAPAAQVEQSTTVSEAVPAPVPVIRKKTTTTTTQGED